MSLSDSISSCAFTFATGSQTTLYGSSSASTICTRDDGTKPSNTIPITKRRRPKDSGGAELRQVPGGKGADSPSRSASSKSVVSRPAFDSRPAVEPPWSTFSAMNVMHAPNSEAASRATSSSKPSPLLSRPAFDCSPGARQRPPVPRPPRVGLPPEAKGGLNKTFASAGALSLRSGQFEELGLSKILEASQSVQNVLGELCSTLRSDWGSQSVQRKTVKVRNTSKETQAARPTVGDVKASPVLPTYAQHRRTSIVHHKMLGRNVAYAGSENIETVELTEDRLRGIMKHPPVTAVRMCMVLCAGNWQEAFKILDNNGNGEISLMEFEAGLECLGVPWKRITGFNSVLDVWRLFDLNGDGVLNINELLGITIEEMEANAWNMQNTREKWFNWCQRTGRAVNLGRNACWKQDEFIRIEADRREEAQHMHEKTVMKCMMEKGIHRTNPRAVAGFLPKVLNEETVSRQRREELDVVVRRGKKIRKVLNDVTTRRKELTSYVQTIRNLTNQQERAKAKEAKAVENLDAMKQAASMLGGVWGKPQSSAHMVNFFSEEALGLDEDELHLRKIARQLGIPIPDAEAIKKCFDLVDTDKSGEIEKPEFKVMMHQMLGGGDDGTGSAQITLSDGRINEFWLSLDNDGSGTVGFDEFLVWYYEQFGAPSLSRSLKQPQLNF